MLIVICISDKVIHPELNASLTIGKEYEVLDRLSSHDNYNGNHIEIDEYLIKCDQDFGCYYPTNMFITQREKNLNELGI
jgi:hypothetical protein